MGLGCDFYYFFFLGRSLSLNGLCLELKRPVVTLVVQGSIFFVPWIVATILFICNLSSASYLIGFLVVLVLPSTITSCVVYTREAGGNTRVCSGTFLSLNLVAPFLFPILCGGWLFGVGYIGVSFLSMAERVYPRLGLLVLLPFILGYLSNKIPAMGEPLRSWERKVPQACILLLSYCLCLRGSSLVCFRPIHQPMDRVDRHGHLYAGWFSLYWGG